MIQVMKLNYRGMQYTAKLDATDTETPFRLYQTNPCLNKYGYWTKSTKLIGKYKELKSCLLYIAENDKNR